MWQADSVLHCCEKRVHFSVINRSLVMTQSCLIYVATFNFGNLFDEYMQIGNAVLNDETDTIGMYDYFGSHAIISDETAFTIRKYCNFSPDAVTQSDTCIDATNDADYNIEAVDIYNIYAPLCFDGNLTTKPKKTSV